MCVREWIAGSCERESNKRLVLGVDRVGCRRTYNGLDTWHTRWLYSTCAMRTHQQSNRLYPSSSHVTPPLCTSLVKNWTLVSRPPRAVGRTHWHRRRLCAGSATGLSQGMADLSTRADEGHSDGRDTPDPADKETAHWQRLRPSRVAEAFRTHLYGVVKEVGRALSPHPRP